MEELIVSALVDKGGVLGLLLSAAVMWIVHREKQIFGSKKEDEGKSKEESLLREFNLRLDVITDSLDELRISNNKTYKKTADFLAYLEHFEKVTLENADRLNSLTEDLKDVNQERVEELKEVLSNYNKTMNELTITLEKIKFILKNKVNEG